MARTYDTSWAFSYLTEVYVPIIQAELRAGRPVPTVARLWELTYGWLIPHIQGHGGAKQVHRQLGYWTDPQRVFEIIGPLCRNGTLPSPAALDAANLKNMRHVIHVHYGMRNLARALGMNAPRERQQRRRERSLQALRRLLLAAARRDQRIPELRVLCQRAQQLLHTNGMRFQLRAYLQDGCPNADRIWLSRLLCERPRVPVDYWTRWRTANGLKPYVIRWIRSGGSEAVSVMLERERRWDLRRAVTRHGGIDALIRDERFFPAPWLQGLWLSYVEKELQRLDRKALLQKRLPSRTVILRRAPRLEFIIRQRCGGYTTTARSLGLRTQRDYLQFVARRRTLRALGDIIVKRGEVPAAVRRHTNDEVLIDRCGGPLKFIRSVSADPDLQLEVRTIAERLKHEYHHDGADPYRHQSLLATHNSLCLILNEAANLA